MTQTHTIERTDKRLGWGRDRLLVKSFPTSDEMHKFLNTGSNGAPGWWQESNKGLKAGTYAYAGGRWHNVKKLDAISLAHI